MTNLERFVAEYSETLRVAFVNKPESVMTKLYPILFVKIYPRNKAGNTNNFDVLVETANGDVLKRGDMSDHADFIKWSKTQADKVEYDS